MARYRPLKLPSSKISMECPDCGWYVVAKDNVIWLCERCGSKGRIDNLMEKYWEDKLGKSLEK